MSDLKFVRCIHKAGYQGATPDFRFGSIGAVNPGTYEYLMSTHGPDASGWFEDVNEKEAKDFFGGTLPTVVTVRHTNGEVKTLSRGPEPEAPKKVKQPAKDVAPDPEDDGKKEEVTEETKSDTKTKGK